MPTIYIAYGFHVLMTADGFVIDKKTWTHAATEASEE